MTTAKQRIEQAICTRMRKTGIPFSFDDLVSMVMAERNLLKRRVRRLAMIRLCNREEDVGYRYAIKYILKLWEE